LREAGYRGETIRLQTNRRYANMFDNSILVQSMLKAAGLNVELEVLEWASQLQNYYESRFELMVFGFSGRTDPALEYLTVVGDRERNRYVQWDTPAVRDLVARAAAAVARDERQSIFDDLHRRMLDELPLLPLYDHYVLDASGPRLRGYRSWAAAKPRLWLVSLAESPP
jgi:peptide/nickel transport system substrate-binding protein